tara:strand:- start:32 stop:925 length:894 start_codon:yes stop_codon:yes gene_type:complete
MEQSNNRPFPALTPAQRYYFEVNGYVIVPDVLSRAECDSIREALQRTKQEIKSRPEDYEVKPAEPRFLGGHEHHVFLGGILQADPLYTAYATHPRLVGMVEEVIGGDARIVEMNAHINSRDPKYDPNAETKYGFHNGIDAPYGSHTKNGLFHCSFVKTLTNLTDLGPDDGGTVVVAGSHKIDVPLKEMIDAAYADPKLIHQVIAPAGSTLLFAETLIHATGQLRSDNERVIIICGYGTSMYPHWGEDKLLPALEGKIPEHLKILFHGKAHWTRGPKYRTLAEPVDPRQFTLADGWHP